MPTTVHLDCQVLFKDKLTSHIIPMKAYLQSETSKIIVLAFPNTLLIIIIITLLRSRNRNRNNLKILVVDRNKIIIVPRYS